MIFGKCVWDDLIRAAGASLILGVTWALSATNSKAKVTISTAICALTAGEHTNTALVYGTVTLQATSGEVWCASPSRRN